MSAFTLTDANSIAKDCGLPGKARVLLPVLQAAEAAHNAALLAESESRDEGRVLKARVAQHVEFAATVERLREMWRGMNSDSRGSMAWVAAFGGDGSPVGKWLALGYEGADADYAGVEVRIEHLMDMLHRLATETPSTFRRKPGRKNTLSGLRAASEEFKRRWQPIGGKVWYPEYSKASKRSLLRADGAEAVVLWRFAQCVAQEPPYTINNCWHATGAHSRSDRA